MFASFTNFLNDVKSTVSAVLDEERAVLEAEQAKIEARGREQQEQQQLRERLAVPLWTVWLPGKRALETDLRTKILKLSTDRRTFLTPIPDSAVYNFSFSAAWPFAMHALRLDAALERARFLLVPRRLGEEEFWRRYLYRVDCLRAVAQVESIVRIPPDEAQARQQLDASRVQAAQPLAMPLAPAASASASAAAAGASTGTAAASAVDDDDFNDEELNRYLNEQLADEDDEDEDNEEPRVNSSPSRSPPPPADEKHAPAESSSSDVPAAAITADTTAAAPTAANVSLVNPAAVVAAQRTPTAPAAAPVTLSTTVPAAAAAAPTPAVPAPQPRATAAAAAVSTPAVPAPKPSPSASAPPRPAAVSAAALSVAAASGSVVVSPLDGSNDDDELAELESMLAGVEDGSGAGVRPASGHDDDSELDEDALAQLESELDMH